MVEYSPLTNASWTPSTTLHRNLLQYEKFTAEAKSQGADIIVFPEYGMSGFITQTRDAVLPYLQIISDEMLHTIPCIDEPDEDFLDIWVIRELSCMARMYGIYIAVDALEKQPCNPDDSKCPPDGRHQYNTAVVFDRKGELIARYRKTHLFFEFGFEDAPIAESITFTTDFGAKFGVIICFDILYSDL